MFGGCFSKVTIGFVPRSAVDGSRTFGVGYRRVRRSSAGGNSPGH
jgi:hypothetical protein